MRIKLKQWNSPSIFFGWSRFQWHLPRFTGSEGGFGVIRPIFSLVRRSGWGLEWVWQLNVGARMCIGSPIPDLLPIFSLVRWGGWGLEWAWRLNVSAGMCIQFQRLQDFIF